MISRMKLKKRGYTHINDYFELILQNKTKNKEVYRLIQALSAQQKKDFIVYCETEPTESKTACKKLTLNYL